MASHVKSLVGIVSRIRISSKPVHSQKETKMKKDKLLLLVSVLGLLSLLLVACGSKKEADLPFPTGKFISSADPNFAQVFNEDGTFRAIWRGSTLATGTYRVSGDTFTTESSDSGCPPWSFKYTWDGTNLTFNYIGDRVDDPCGGTRGNAFDNQTYTPAGEPNFPTGKFINSGAPNFGQIFNEDGTFSAFMGSSTLVTGTYSVDGDTFTMESDDSGCPSWSFKYTWDGTNLIFNYIGNRADDPCGVHRGPAFDNVTYTLSEE
jgi:predicted secreted protein